MSAQQGNPNPPAPDANKAKAAAQAAAEEQGEAESDASETQNATDAPSEAQKALAEAVEDMRLQIGMDKKAFTAGFGTLSVEQQYSAIKAVKAGMKPRITKNEPIIPQPTGGGQSPYQGKITGEKVSFKIPLTVIANNTKK